MLTILCCIEMNESLIGNQLRNYWGKNILFKNEASKSHGIYKVVLRLLTFPYNNAKFRVSMFLRVNKLSIPF